VIHQIQFCRTFARNDRFLRKPNVRTGFERFSLRMSWRTKVCPIWFPEVETYHTMDPVIYIAIS